MVKNIIFNLLRYIRYVVYRYFINGLFSSSKVYHGTLHDVANFRESFFGYYNLSPENIKGESVVCVPQINNAVNIMLVKSHDNIKKLDITFAWNWQQGCMLQWSNKKEAIYYNIFDENTFSYKMKVLDVSDMNIVDTLPIPVCAIAKDETYALSLNFERLAIMRPDYGYFCRKEVVLPDNNNDGIWKIDLKTKEIKLIISLLQLIELKRVDTMNGAMHKVNHIDIAPDGERFMFLHRWVGKQGRFTRLITANKNGTDMYILNGDIMTSHSCWLGNNRIISFCHTEKHNNAYVILTDKTGNVELLSDKLPTSDGHPSVSPNGKWLITDTYPDINRMSKILLLNLQTKKVFFLGRFYQPLKYQGTNRIDLHPKWNMNGNKIYFESGHNGHRNLYSLDIAMVTK